MTESLVFTDALPLQDTHVPQTLVARQPQVEQCMSLPKAFATGGSLVHLLVFGAPGSGKTALARHVLQRVAEETRAKTAYVNCWQAPTLFGVADSVVEQLRVMFAERPDTTHKLARIRKVIGNGRLVLVLDEFDRAVPKERDNILYQFLQWENVSLACVAISRGFLMNLDNRVRSRFAPVHVECVPYLSDDVFTILADRASDSLKQGSYDAALLKLIATQTEGDARMAINILRQAAQLADVSRSPRIQAAEVDRAFGEMKLVRRKYLLERLTPHHRIIVDVVDGEPAVDFTALWEKYQVECQRQERSAVALRTFHSYVARLTDLKLIRSEPKPGDGTSRVFFLA